MSTAYHITTTMPQWRLLLKLIISALILEVCEGVSQDPTRIRLQKGWVSGNRHNVLNGNIVHEYLGVPMGKPPVGERRFKRPEPVDPWPGEFKATTRPNACYNVQDNAFGKFRGSHMWNPRESMNEDCLYINVWVPNPGDTSALKPIMVWIFGGGFYSGSSTLDIYDGRYLAASQNVIVISMQYRLGMLGFLNLDSELAPGNMGLLDQHMGLMWTQENAEYLFGDKNNVTIFGESAGSVSVGLHLVSPLSRNLFNRAIMQSGSPASKWSLMSSENSWLRLNKTIYSPEMNCPVSSHVPTIMDCLMNLPPNVLNDYGWASQGPVQFSWLPSVDYYFLTERPEVSLEDGNFKKCPLLIGSNANEGSVYILYEFFDDGFGANYNIDELDFSVTKEKHDYFLHKAFRYYPQWNTPMNSFGKDAITFQYTSWENPDDTKSNVHNLDMAIGDYHFLCPTNKFAQYYMKAGMDVFQYFFNHKSTRSAWGDWMGVMHGDDVAFVFGEPIRPDSLYTDEEKQLSQQMMELWSSFSKTGIPSIKNDDGSQAWVWPKANTSTKLYYELSVPSLSGKIIGSGPRLQYCAFWNNYLPGLVKATGDISEAEAEWKREFHDWKTKYIVDWKHEYKNYVNLAYNQKPCDTRN